MAVTLSYSGLSKFSASFACRKPFLTKITSDPLSMRHLATLVLPSAVLTWIQQMNVSTANPHLLRISRFCPRLAAFWPFYVLRRYR